METKRRFIGDPQTDFGPQMTPAFEEFMQGVELSDAFKDFAEINTLEDIEPTSVEDYISGLMDQAPDVPSLVDTPLGSVTPSNLTSAAFGLVGGAGFGAGFATGLMDVAMAQGVQSPFEGHMMPVTNNTALDFVTSNVMEQHVKNAMANPDDVFSIDGDLVSIGTTETPFGLMRSITGNYSGTIEDIDRRSSVAKGISPDTGDELAGGADGKGGYDLTTGNYVDQYGNVSYFGPNSKYQDLSAEEKEAVQAGRRGEGSAQDDADDDFDEAQQPEE